MTAPDQLDPSRVSSAQVRGSIKRGLAGFTAGFQGTTWDDKAEEEIQGDLRVFDEMRSLPAAYKQRLRPTIKPLLESRRDSLRTQAAVKAVTKRVTWILCIFAVGMPAVVVGLVTPDGGHSVWLYFSMLLGVLFSIVWPAHILRMVTGRTRPELIWVTLVIWAYIAAAAWIVTGHDSGDPIDAILVAVACAVTVLAIVLLAALYIVAWNEIALTHAWTEQRVEATVVCLLLGVVQVLAGEPGEDDVPRLGVVRILLAEPGDDIPTPLQRSGRARALLALAASAVNEYLPRLIDGGGVYRADAQSTAHEAVAALLDLGSAVNLPDGHLGESDRMRLTAAIRAWSIGSLADLPRKSPDPADSPGVSWPPLAVAQTARKLGLGAFPLILLIATTLLPVTMPTAVTAALAPFAVTWLLLSIASVFSPADVKMDLKSLFKN